MGEDIKQERKLHPNEVSIIKKVVAVLSESGMSYKQANDLIPELQKYLKLHSVHQLIKTEDHH